MMNCDTQRSRFCILKALFLMSLLCCTLAGCATKSHVRYFALNLPDAPPPASNPNGVSVAVARIEMAPALQDERIHYRSGKTGAGSYANDHWSEPPAITMRDGMIRLLAASGKYRWVSQPGGTTASDFVVRGKLHEFAEIDEPVLHTRASLGVEIYDRRQTRIVCQKEFAQEEPVSGGRAVSDVTESLDAATQALLVQAVEAINVCLAEPPAS